MMIVTLKECGHLCFRGESLDLSLSYSIEFDKCGYCDNYSGCLFCQARERQAAKSKEGNLQEVS